MLWIALTIRRNSFDCLPQSRKTSAWFRRLLFSDDAADFFELGAAQSLLVKGGRARKQLVQEYAQSVDVSPRVDVQPAVARLLGAHVGRRADHPSEARVHRLLR